MAQLIDATVIANEPTLRYTPDGTAVINLALPCEYGKKDQSGKKPTQWVEASLWGARAEGLAPYLVKRQMIAFTLDDVHIEEFKTGGGETRTKLVGRVSHIKLIGAAPDRQQGQQQPAHQSSNTAPAQNSQQRPADFDNFDDDIPF